MRALALAISFGKDRLEQPRQDRLRGDRAGRRGRGPIKTRDQLAAQAVEQTHRHHRPALDHGVDPGELINRAA